MNSRDRMKSIIFDVSPVRWALCKLAGKVYRSVYVSRIGGLKLTETSVPTLPDGNWVLCKTLLGGICGTDLNTIFMNQHPASMIQNFVSFPMMLGHENVARVVKVGSGVSGLEMGQRVIVDPSHSCAVRGIEPLCEMCRSGRISSCENFDRGGIAKSIALGYNNFTGGSWSEYFVAHKSQIVPLPDNISDEQAILVDPLACSLHCVLQSLPKDGENILIFGSGIIAFGIMFAIRLLGIDVKITATVKYPFQEELANHCGADNVVFWSRDNKERSVRELANFSNARAMCGRFSLRFLRGGFDRVYDCTGNVGGIVDVLRFCKAGGNVIVAGTPQLGLIDLTPVWFDEITVRGVTGRAIESLPTDGRVKHDYFHILEFISEGKMDVSVFPLKFFRQDEYKQALLYLRNRSKFPVIKSVFDFR